MHCASSINHSHKKCILAGLCLWVVSTPVQHVLKFMESKIGRIWDILHTTHVIRREVVDMGKMDMWRQIDVKAAASQTMCNVYHCSTQWILHPGVIGYFNAQCPVYKSMMWSLITDQLWVFVCFPWFDNFTWSFNNLLLCSESFTSYQHILSASLIIVNERLQSVWTFAGYN